MDRLCYTGSQVNRRVEAGVYTVLSAASPQCQPSFGTDAPLLWRPLLVGVAYENCTEWMNEWMNVGWWRGLAARVCGVFQDIEEWIYGRRELLYCRWPPEPFVNLCRLYMYRSHRRHKLDCVVHDSSWCRRPGMQDGRRWLVDRGTDWYQRCWTLWSFVFLKKVKLRTKKIRALSGTASWLAAGGQLPWYHTLLPSTWHKWTHTALTPNTSTPDVGQ